MPFAGGNFRHILVEGFVSRGGKIERVGPLHAFDDDALEELLSSVLKGAEGAVLKFTIEAIEPDECINHSLKRRSSIEVFGHIPEELKRKLRRELEDGDPEPSE